MLAQVASSMLLQGSSSSSSALAGATQQLARAVLSSSRLLPAAGLRSIRSVAVVSNAVIAKV